MSKVLKSICCISAVGLFSLFLAPSFSAIVDPKDRNHTKYPGHNVKEHRHRSKHRRKHHHKAPDLSPIQNKSIYTSLLFDTPTVLEDKVADSTPLPPLSTNSCTSTPKQSFPINVAPSVDIGAKVSTFQKTVLAQIQGEMLDGIEKVAFKSPEEKAKHYISIADRFNKENPADRSAILLSLLENTKGIADRIDEMTTKSEVINAIKTPFVMDNNETLEFAITKYLKLKDKESSIKYSKRK